MFIFLIGMLRFESYQCTTIKQINLEFKHSQYDPLTKIILN